MYCELPRVGNLDTFNKKLTCILYILNYVLSSLVFYPDFNREPPLHFLEGSRYVNSSIFTLL